MYEFCGTPDLGFIRAVWKARDLWDNRALKSGFSVFRNSQG